MSKAKVPSEEKIRAVEAYLNGELGYSEACKKFNIDCSVWRSWIRLYRTHGPEGLTPRAITHHYPNSLRALVVKEYLSGETSLRKLCKKHAISHPGTISLWMKQYNGQKGSSQSEDGSESFMTEIRRTTLEERIEMVSYCMENNLDYGKATEKYGISYKQIYSWVRKYKAYGLDGLSDRRGKPKEYDEMTEVERLKARIKILEAEKKSKEMEIAILKKLQEIGRKWD